MISTSECDAVVDVADKIEVAAFVEVSASIDEA